MCHYKKTCHLPRNAPPTVVKKNIIPRILSISWLISFLFRLCSSATKVVDGRSVHGRCRFLEDMGSLDACMHNSPSSNSRAWSSAWRCRYWSTCTSDALGAAAEPECDQPLVGEFDGEDMMLSTWDLDEGVLHYLCSGPRALGELNSVSSHETIWISLMVQIHPTMCATPTCSLPRRWHHVWCTCGFRLDQTCGRPCRLGSILLSDEHAGAWPVGELGDTRPDNIHASHATEYAEVIHLGLIPSPHLVCCYPLKTSHQSTVQDVHRRSDGLRPELRWHAHTLHEALCHLHHGLVPPHNNSVLLRGIRCRSVPADSSLLAELKKISIIDFAASICFKCSELHNISVGLVFAPILPDQIQREV
jgi:hypothetical protein